MYLRSSGTNPGRDGCRVPLPWSGAEPPFGFSPTKAAAEPWLPQPANWASRTVEAQSADPHSMLRLYRTALRLRRDEPGLGDGTFAWLDSAPGVLAFRRSPEFVCVLNLDSTPAKLPPHTQVLLASGPLGGDGLPADTAAWLRG
jgi:alpha-glucosidase